MFVTPYQTTPCKDYNLKNILAEVITEKNMGNLIQLERGIAMVGSGSTNIPIFTQPLSWVDFDRSDVPNVLFDARGFMSMTRGEATPWRITNHTEYEFQMLRAKIQNEWQSGTFDRLDYLRCGDIAPQVFINWISKNIGTRLGLDPLQVSEIMTLVGLYYIALFYQADEFDETVKMKAVGQINRWTKIPTQIIMPLVDGQEYIADLPGLVAALKKTVQSPRMEQVSVGLLYAMLGGSWFGANSKETVAVALEHPPTFITLLYSAINARSYRNTVLGKVSQLATRAGNDREFTKNLTFLINKR